MSQEAQLQNGRNAEERERKRNRDCRSEGGDENGIARAAFLGLKVLRHQIGVDRHGERRHKGDGIRFEVTQPKEPGDEPDKTRLDHELHDRNENALRKC